MGGIFGPEGKGWSKTTTWTGAGFGLPLASSPNLSLIFSYPLGSGLFFGMAMGREMETGCFLIVRTMSKVDTL